MGVALLGNDASLIPFLASNGVMYMRRGNLKTLAIILCNNFNTALRPFPLMHPILILLRLLTLDPDMW